MKLRQISFKLVSLVMVLAILFSVSATTISAATQVGEHTHDENNDKIHYVSLGDSMTNGYCFDGYAQSELAPGAFVGGNGGYGYDAYPNLFAQWLADNYNVEVDHAQLAVSAMRAEDLLYFLGGREKPTDGWTGQVNNYTDEYDDEVLSNYIIENVANADIISMGIGNASFGAYLLHRVTDSLGIFGASLDEDEKVTLEDALIGLDDEQKQVVLDIYDEVMASLMEYVPENIEEYGVKNLEDIANLIAYVSAGFILNYAGVVDRIVELNPDVELILVGLMNTTYGMTVTVDGADPVPVGDFMDEVFALLNAYVAGYPVAKQASGEYENAEFYYADIDNIEFISQMFDDLKDADWGVLNGLDGRVVRDRNIDAYNDSLREAIGGAFGMPLAEITLKDVEAYEAAVEAGETLYVVNFDQYWQVTGYNKNLSIAVYLGIEDAVAASCEITEIPLDGLVTIVTDLFSVFEDLTIDFNNPVAEDLHATLGNYLTSTDSLQGMCKIYALFKVGNGMSVHPTPKAHKALADEIIAAYEGDHTALDETVKNVVKYAEMIADYFAENYEQIYADVHTELREQGVIDELNNYIDIASKAIGDAYAVVDGTKVGERFELSKQYVLAELDLMDATLVQIKNLVNYETITPETLVTLDALLANLEAHAENLADLGIELATISNEQLMVAVAELEAQAHKQIEILKAQVNHQLNVLNKELETAVGEARDAILAEIAVLEKYLADEIAKIEAQLEADIAALVENVEKLNKAVENAINATVKAVEFAKDFTLDFVYNVYTHIYNEAPVTYEQFVNALVDAIAVYSHEAAQLAYDWLINNPEKVIEFFAIYGDDIADFVVDNHEIIFAVIGYVGMTYGEDILNLVLDNADVILPAIAGWFEIHGDLVWDLIVVYFNAIVEYYNLGLDLDFSTPEGIHASLNKIFGLLGELLSMIADGVYDLVDALNLIDEIEAALAALDGQIRVQIETVLGELDAHVAEKIAAITAQINKQIEALKAQAEKQLAILYAQLETAVGAARDAILAEIARIEAELAAQIEALKAQLEALIQAEINNAEDLAAALDALLKDGTYALGQLIYDAIAAYVNDAVRGEFTPNEETVYVSVSSGDDYYAQLLAAALSDMAKSEITAESTVWGDLDYDLLASADLVTIGYSASELTSFAVAQLFGYVKEFINNDIRNTGLGYADSVFAGIHAYVDGLNASLGEYGNIELDTSKEEEYVNGQINSFVDALIGEGELSDEHYELMGDYGLVAILAGSFLADASLEELDWAKYVGEDNLHYVDDLRNAIRAELVKQGVMDNYAIEIPVLDYALNSVFGSNDYITYEGVTIKRAMLEKHLEGAENVVITLPVVDSLIFAIESYIYSNVAFNYEYGKLIVDLYKTNPDVTIVLLGQYNAFDYEIDVFGEYVDLGALYTYVAQINSVQPFAYALLSENVAYVDISDAETYYESFLKDGTDDSLLNFVLNFVLDPSITDLSEAGHEYVYEQIMNVLTLYCDHVYDNACDTDCNKCGEIRVTYHVYDNACDTDCNVCGAIREVADHVYVDGECIHCGKVEPTEPEIPDAPTHNFHVFDDCNDATCNECDYVRVVIGHVYDDCVDATCYMCDYVRDEVPGHKFGNCGEDTCERCGKTRPATTHVYNNACDDDCNRCGVTREVPAHVYSGCTDAACNVCGAERQATAHTISNKCTDNICDVCGQNVAVNGHVFGAWTVTVEPTRKTEGQQTRTCTGCGLVETATIDALGGIGGGAIAAIVTGSAAVSGAGGFGIYWFLIQKKTFAQLLAALGKGAVATAAVAADAATEAAAETGAEAVAEAAAEAASETIAE